jgi:quercetin dioxygenase-like cupin family protein
MFIYPHTIENKQGEKLSFLRIVHEPGGDKLETEGWCKPKAGPPTHVHWKQDESLTVISGKMATQIPGQDVVYHGPEETATFLRGTWHRFWNAGEDELHIKGWVSPPNNIVYFLTGLYKAIDDGKNGRPELTAASYLSIKYKSEFAAQGIPGFVRKVIMPLNYFFGKISGAHKQFKDSPPPL